MAAAQPDWLVGFEDEVWFSRLAQPGMGAWTFDKSKPLRLRLCSKERASGDKAAKALACYGLFLPEEPPLGEPVGKPAHRQMLLRFVTGRPVSRVTCAFLAWVCQQVAARGKRALVLFWDNASWHRSREVKEWIRRHNRSAKPSGGLRLLVCPLPKRSPWLNRIEPRWVQGKRAVAEPERVLSPQELTERLCGYYGCEHLEPLQQ